MAFRLGKGETIVTAYAQPANGPGWANEPLYVVVRDANGKLREECLQPREQGDRIRLLYDMAAVLHAMMHTAVLCPGKSKGQVMAEPTIEEMIHAVLFTDAWHNCKGETVRTDGDIDGAWEDFIREAYRALQAEKREVNHAD